MTGRPGLAWWAIFVALSVTVAVGLVAYAYQLRNGLSVTGLGQRVSWGFYISNLVFFIGISYGGAITSAILRLTNAPWRAPLTRMAEAMAWKPGAEIIGRKSRGCVWFTNSSIPCMVNCAAHWL